MTWQVYRAASSDHGAWTNRPCRRACTAEDREAGDRVPTSAGDARGERFTGTCKRSPMLIADAASRYRAIARGDGPAYAQEHLSAGTYLAGPSGRHPQLLAQTLVARIRSSRERHRDYRGCCTAGGCAVRFVAVACWRAPTVAILRRRSPRCSQQAGTSVRPRRNGAVVRRVAIVIVCGEPCRPPPPACGRSGSARRRIAPRHRAARSRE